MVGICDMHDHPLKQAIYNTWTPPFGIVRPSAGGGPLGLLHCRVIATRGSDNLGRRSGGKTK